MTNGGLRTAPQEFKSPRDKSYSNSDVRLNIEPVIVKQNVMQH